MKWLRWIRATLARSRGRRRARAWLRRMLMVEQRQFYAYLREAGYPANGGHIVVEETAPGRDRFAKAILWAIDQTGRQTDDPEEPN